VRKLRARLEVTSSNPRNRARVKNLVTCDVRVCEGLPGTKAPLSTSEAGILLSDVRR
jgi:hypothetical protein